MPLVTSQGSQECALLSPFGSVARQRDVAEPVELLLLTSPRESDWARLRLRPKIARLQNSVFSSAAQEREAIMVRLRGGGGKRTRVGGSAPLFFFHLNPVWLANKTETKKLVVP